MIESYFFNFYLAFPGFSLDGLGSTVSVSVDVDFWDIQSLKSTVWRQAKEAKLCRPINVYKNVIFLTTVVIQFAYKSRISSLSASHWESNNRLATFLKIGAFALMFSCVDCCLLSTHNNEFFAVIYFCENNEFVLACYCVRPTMLLRKNASLFTCFFQTKKVRDQALHQTTTSLLCSRPQPTKVTVELMAWLSSVACCRLSSVTDVFWLNGLR